MKKMALLLLVCFFCGLANAQNQWSWTALAPIPIHTTDNAVCEALLSQGKFVYSFGGMQDVVSPSSVHQRVFKYNVTTDTWAETAHIPDTAGKIDNFASFVQQKIYLIGGKYVLDDSTFVTADKVHIYNPQTDTFEADGSPLPIPVSGQVQAVWNDSLIYVISGLSNGTTTPAVQIYNPSQDTWSSGTPLPDTNKFKCYGASGYILGDTIYYFGGAIQYPSSATVNYFRKGVINPSNPTVITWTFVSKSIGSPQYKSVCSGHNQTLFWVGGTDKTYNFDLKNAEDSTLVSPNMRLMEIKTKNLVQTNSFDPLNNVMDLNGMANVGGGNWIITGGIDSLHQVTNTTYLLHNPSLTDIKDALHPPFFKVYSIDDEHFIVKTDNIGKVFIYNTIGQLFYTSDKGLADLKVNKSELPEGILFFVYMNNISLPVTIKVVNPE